MIKKELFEWAKNNSGKYPALEQLREKVIDDIDFIELPIKYGTYKGIYFCGHDNPSVHKLRNDGYAVGIITNYAIIQKYILEFAKNKI